MCTLTYRLTETGYELFFNRDEQRSRAKAYLPKLNADLHAIYPLDPIGKGTWLAVHQSGLSLALLNYYQVEKKLAGGHFISRGELILRLLKNPNSVIETLKSMDLQHYQPFQLCLFPADLRRNDNKLSCFQWDSFMLTEQQQTLPITSSGVDYAQVYQARKKQFTQLVSLNEPTTKQLLAFHQSQKKEGKLSVKMCREDAKTVSFSHLCIDDEITFNYVDYLDDQQCRRSIKRIF